MLHAKLNYIIPNVCFQMKDNVAFDIIGHAYFLEDGAEKATILEGNLGATIKQIKGNGFDTDAS